LGGKEGGTHTTEDRGRRIKLRRKEGFLPLFEEKRLIVEKRSKTNGKG